MSAKYGIAEWFGEPLHGMAVNRRNTLAEAALGLIPAPPCPFQEGTPACSKAGGVCSIRKGQGQPAITCPMRFETENLLPCWLADVVGFSEAYIAREVPFMQSPETGRSAGRIDLIVASGANASTWFGLEIQAVYFSGDGMQSDFQALLVSHTREPPKPTGVRRPDWRSSSAKRLMPQLQVKGPTLRRWGTKLAVAVDRPFFEAIGGPSVNPSRDLDDGTIIWFVPEMTEDFRLQRYHWEVLSLEESSQKLLSANTVKRKDFEYAMRAKLRRIDGYPI